MLDQDRVTTSRWRRLKCLIFGHVFTVQSMRCMFCGEAFEESDE